MGVSESLARVMGAGVLRYSQVWEDHALVEQGLAVGPDDDVLTIASAGCNAFALLLAGAKSVTAIDLNRAQLAVCDLKVAAFRRLEHGEILRLLGITPGEDRLALYDRIRDELPEPSALWLDKHRKALAAGLHWSGRLEAYFGAFAHKDMPTVHPRSLLEELLQQEDREKQRAFFDERFATPALVAAMRRYFTADSLAAEGRDKRLMRHADDGDVSTHFFKRLRHVCTAIPTRGNFYLASLLLGEYLGDVVPPYLRPEALPTIRARLDRLTFVHEDLAGHLRGLPAGHYRKANLSDLFEYLSPEESDELFALLAERLAPSGRFVFWSMLVPREPSAHLRPRLRSHEALARGLWEQDRAVFYRSFHVEEVGA